MDGVGGPSSHSEGWPRGVNDTKETALYGATEA